jgi:hypothetical protein
MSIITKLNRAVVMLDFKFEKLLFNFNLETNNVKLASLELTSIFGMILAICLMNLSNLSNVIIARIGFLISYSSLLLMLYPLVSNTPIKRLSAPYAKLYVVEHSLSWC